VKKKKQILEVDFIGGEGPLTSSEEKAISEYFKTIKQKSSTKIRKSNKLNNGRKSSVV
jgi:hypothetical protein